MFVFGSAEDVFTMAIRIEENGSAFYSMAASRAANPTARDLFRDLAAMEEGHVRAFKTLRSELSNSTSPLVWDPEGLAESYLQATADTHIFTVEAANERLEKDMSAQQVLETAMQFEKDSVAFFVGMKEILPDPNGKAEIDKLIKAEMDHIRMLSAVMRDLSTTGAAQVPH
ncbi:MAG: ferritin family protein [Desulfomonilaceae bacterium]